MMMGSGAGIFLKNPLCVPHVSTQQPSSAYRHTLQIVSPLALMLMLPQHRLCLTYHCRRHCRQ